MVKSNLIFLSFAEALEEKDKGNVHYKNLTVPLGISKAQSLLFEDLTVCLD